MSFPIDRVGLLVLFLAGFVMPILADDAPVLQPRQLKTPVKKLPQAMRLSYPEDGLVGQARTGAMRDDSVRLPSRARSGQILPVSASENEAKSTPRIAMPRRADALSSGSAGRTAGKLSAD